jgi:hypothetical protein
LTLATEVGYLFRTPFNSVKSLAPAVLDQQYAATYSHSLQLHGSADAIVSALGGSYYRPLANWYGVDYLTATLTATVDCGNSRNDSLTCSAATLSNGTYKVLVMAVDDPPHLSLVTNAFHGIFE